MLPQQHKGHLSQVSSSAYTSQMFICNCVLINHFHTSVVNEHTHTHNHDSCSIQEFRLWLGGHNKKQREDSGVLRVCRVECAPETQSHDALLHERERERETG